MTIILPNDDPMVQRAKQANQQDQQMNAVIQGMKNQMFISIFTQFALKHADSGEELNLEVGRELANKTVEVATKVVNEYSGFMFEKMGIAKIEKVDNPVKVK